MSLSLTTTPPQTLMPSTKVVLFLRTNSLLHPEDLDNRRVEDEADVVAVDTIAIDVDHLLVAEGTIPLSLPIDQRAVEVEEKVAEAEEAKGVAEGILLTESPHLLTIKGTPPGEAAEDEASEGTIIEEAPKDEGIEVEAEVEAEVTEVAVSMIALDLDEDLIEKQRHPQTFTTKFEGRK